MTKSHPPRRVAVLTAAVALVAGTGVFFWLQHDADAPAPEGVVTAASSATRSGAPASRGAVPGALPDAAEAAKAASQARLSPVSETLRHPGAAGDVIARIQQRQAMSRLFADAQDIERARSENALMAPASADAAIGHMGFLSERQKSDGRSFVRYDLRTLESRVEGDQFDIFLPGAGLTARAVVEQVESVDGMLRWSGRILDFQEGGQFSVTHALQDSYAVGTFNTPVGNFSMEAKNGWGWVATQSSDFFLPAGGDDGVPAPFADAAVEPAHR